ncbi:MAG TPA: MASE1 domain-containing protein, partial [Polyangia bacterium]
MYSGQLAAVATAYVVLGVLGLTVAPIERFATLLWAPSGLSLAALVLGGYRLWPAVALGALVTNLLMGAPAPVAVGIAAGNTLEALAGSFALRSLASFRGSLDRVAEVVRLAVPAALLSTAISATVGTASVTLGGLVPSHDFAHMWRAWWTGDLVGDLIVAPVILTWARGPRPFVRRPASAYEGLALGAALLGLTLAVVARRPAVAAHAFVGPYVLLVPLVWAALRFGVRGAATGTLLLAFAAVWATATGLGPFVRADESDSLLALDFFLAAAAVTALVLGAVASEREQSRRSLRESEERQRLAVEAAQLGTWFWQEGDDRVAWSPLCRAMHGVGPDEPLTPRRFLDLLDPEDRAPTLRAATRAFEEHTEFRVEYRVTWPDGSVHWLSVLGRAFARTAFAPRRIMGVTLDTTAQKQVERERAALLERERAARAEAQAATRAKDEFLAVLSHELRTPLQAILGWAQRLIMGEVDAATLARGLETINRNARTQARLIEDLLDVSRIVAGKLLLQHEPVDLEQMVASALESARAAAEAQSIRLDCDIEPQPGQVLGDPERLLQIVANLLSNAVKFTPRGGRISVGLSRVGPTATIVVTDTGRGISPELLPLIFDRFRQAESATVRSRGGLGLGLAIVRHLVELHGGTVRAESPGEGRGATFTVALPVVSARRPA